MNLRYLPFTKWWHWILGLLLATGGLSMSAIAFLAQSPQENSCVSESKFDTASAIIYCATTTVNEQDPKSLSSSIRLANTVPPDNPLRSNADNLIERWSQSVIHLSDKAFHEGDINKAVEIAQDIPENHAAFGAASEQIKKWQSIWSQAEGIYTSAKTEVEDGSKNWYAALSKAKQLQKIENEYWANTKYYELVRHIQGAREDREKDESENKSTSSKPQNSVASEDTSELAQLKKARVLANSRKLDDMRSAVVEASMVISEPHAKEARKLVAETEKKIAVSEDSIYLDEAKNLAAKNDEISLKMAVNEAKLIGKERPLYKQANQQIAIWEKKISQLANQPVQASNVSLKAPNRNQIKVSSNKPTAKPQAKFDQKFEISNELKPILTNTNMEESIYPSIEKLEEMQLNYQSE
jgi:hypothetical protein